MTSSAQQISRRQLITGIFRGSSAHRKALTPVRDTAQVSDGVCWRMVRTADGKIFVAADEGRIGCFEDGAWAWEQLPGAHNLHSICTVGMKTIAVGWHGAIYENTDSRWRLSMGGDSSPGRENTPLFDVCADVEGNFWAVGDAGRVVRSSNGIWSEEPEVTKKNLRAVATLPDGRILASGLDGTLLLRNEQGWEIIETDTRCPLVSIAVTADHEIIIVGGEYSASTRGFVGRIFQLLLDNPEADKSTTFINKTERKQNLDFQEIETDAGLPRLRRVRVIDDALIIVGDHGFAMQLDGSNAQVLNNVARYDLHDALADNDETWFCGDCGSVMRLGDSEVLAKGSVSPDPSQWICLEEGATNGTLRTVVPLEPGHLIAAGDGGRIAHIKGGAVRWEQLPEKLRVHTLWASSPNNVIAGCEAGTLMHWDGETWSSLHRGRPDSSILSICGFGAHDIFAVGDNGYALRYDGLMWREVDTGVKQELYGLWGPDSAHLLAVGGGGLVLRFNGEKFRTFQAGTDLDLYAVQGTGLETIFLCGLNGTLIRYENNRWHREFSGVRGDLHALETFKEQALCVGSNGTVLHRDRDTHGVFRWTPEQAPTEQTLHAIHADDDITIAVGANGTILKRT